MNCKWTASIPPANVNKNVHWRDIYTLYFRFLCYFITTPREGTCNSCLWHIGCFVNVFFTHWISFINSVCRFETKTHWGECYALKTPNISSRTVKSIGSYLKKKTHWNLKQLPSVNPRCSLSNPKWQHPAAGVNMCTKYQLYVVPEICYVAVTHNLKSLA